MTHREVLEALSGLLLAMFVAMLSSTVVTNALPRDRHRPARQPDRLHLGRRGHPAGDDRDHPDLGQARRPVQQEAARAERAGHLLDRLADRRLRAQHGGADRRPRRPGPRRRRPHRAGPGRHRLDGLARASAAATPATSAPSSRSPRSAARSSAASSWTRPASAGAGASSSACRSRCSPSSCCRRRCTCRSSSATCSIDYLGATLHRRPASRCCWSGSRWPATSSTGSPATSRWLVVGGLAVVAAAIYVEARVAVEPIIPLRLFKDRTTALATAASVLIGVAMFGSTVYLSQYFQLARGMSPTEAGLMSVAHGRRAAGLQHRQRPDHHAGPGGGSAAWSAAWCWSSIGLALLGTIDATTHLAVVGVFMAVLGLGLGATMQNLVLAVQNNTAQSDMGAASSVVAFFRSMGGSIGVSALGRGAQPPGRRQGGRRAGQRWASRRHGHAEPLDPRPDDPAGAGPRALRERLRRRRPASCSWSPCRSRCSRWSASCSSARCRCAPPIDEPPRSVATEPTGARWQRERAMSRRGRDTADLSRAETLRRLEREVGVLIRRIKRVIGERARGRARGPAAGVVPDARLRSPTTARCGPRSMAEKFDIDKGAVSRQVQHLVDLGLVDRTPDPADGRAALLVGQRRRPCAGSPTSSTHRRKWLDERLGDWSDEELAELRRPSSAATTPRSRTPRPAVTEPAARSGVSAARPRCRPGSVAGRRGPLATSTSPRAARPAPVPQLSTTVSGPRRKASTSAPRSSSSTSSRRRRSDVRRAASAAR